MTANEDWIQGALDALDNVIHTMSQMRDRIARLQPAWERAVEEAMKEKEQADLHLLTRHAIAGSEMRTIEFWSALPDVDMKNEPASRREIEAAAARLLNLLEQRRLEAKRWREIAERFRETVDNETWRGLLEEYGLQDDDLDPST